MSTTGTYSVESTIAAQNPWLGLASYTEHDRDGFFGRHRETEELLRMIEGEALTVLFGRSGFGKTSLLRAGVIPELRLRGYFPVIARLDYSAGAPDPVLQLKRIVIESAKSDVIDIENEPEEPDSTLWEYFHRVEFWGRRNDHLTPVLVLDQFEEVFTIGQNTKHSAAFLEQLADLVENRVPLSIRADLEASGDRLAIDMSNQRYKVVLSLREDFVPKLDSLRPIMPAIMRHRFVLNPLQSERALEVVLQGGREWVSGEVAREIVRSVAGSTQALDDADGAQSGRDIEPAYLSVMCHELFRRMVTQGRTVITLDLLAEEHGEILEGLYERSFSGLHPHVRKFVEDRLITHSGFRGTLPLSDATATGISAADLETLVNRRLLRFEDRLGTRHVELSHDLLTRVVQRSRDGRRAIEAQEAEAAKQRELHKKLVAARIRTLIAASAALLLLAGVVYTYLAYYRTHYSYWANFVKRHGKVEPVGRLTAEHVRHRTSTLRLIRKGFRGDVLALEAIDSNGALTENHSIKNYMTSDQTDTPERASRWEFVYDAKGRVIYEIARDRLGQMVWGFVYSPEREDAESKQRTRSATFIGADGYPQPQRKSRAEFVEFEYDERGYERKHRFMDREGRPAPGPDGAYGRIFEVDDRGFILQMTSVDMEGRPVNDSAGNASLRMEYDAQGNMVRSFALDAEGKPTLFRTLQFARADFTFDQWGNIETVTTFDTTGRPVRQADVGCEVMKNSFDDQGNLLEARCYNSAGQPVDRVSTDGLVYHLRRMTYGERNLPVSESYFDKDEKPVNGGRGWHRATFGYDSNGFRNEWRYFDAAGKPVAPNGYHIQREIKNKVGLASEVRWFGVDLQPVAYRGSHQMHLYYDAHGNRRAETYFGVDGKPATDAESGCHRFTSQYDRFRNVTQTEKFDIAGNRTRGTGTFHRKIARFNEFGENVSEQYFDESLQPALGPDGVHQIKRTMDDRGREIAIEYFGTNGKPAENAEEIHRSLFEYNQKNQQTKRQHFGKDDAPASDLAGVHLAINEYDGVGRSVRETRLGKHLEGVWMPSLHIATQRIRYDSQGNINDLAWFDSQDRLMPGPLGFARMTVEQQPDGTKIYTNCGTNNKPTISRLLGWARTRHKYRDGRLVSQSFHAPDDSLMEGPDGWAVRSDEYDSEGRLLRREHRDRYLKPVYTVEGYFRGELRPGAKAADLSDYTFFDIQNRPMRLDENIGLPYVSEISSADAVAVSIGLAPGDIVWRLGTWFVPEAVLRARQQGMAGKMAEFLISEFLAQLKQIKLPATLSVLRDGRLVNVSVPRIPLGVKINGRHLRPEDYDRLVQSAGVRAYAQR